MVNVLELAKSASYRCWADAPLAAMRQLSEIGSEYSQILAGAGIVSLNDIEKAGPQKIGQVCGLPLL